MQKNNPNTAAVALITGGAKRIGAALAQALHDDGWRVLLHYHQSAAEAEALVARFNERRPDSAHALAANLLQPEAVEALAEAAITHWGQIDLLINNASTYYPSPVGEFSLSQWQDLLGSNLQAPLFLSQALAPSLAEQRGSIINFIDIQVEKLLPKHALYLAAKAGLRTATQALALELAPKIRVNGIAPGAILWPEPEPDAPTKANKIAKIPLQRLGTVADIVAAARYLIAASYVTGEILSVDGGSRLA